MFLNHHREDLQGRSKLSKGGRSGTMIYAYPFTLARRAAVATLDLGAQNLAAFTDDHWLSNNTHVIGLWFRGEAWAA